MKEKPIEAIPLAADEMPVIVTGIQSDSNPHPYLQEDILFFDNDRPPSGEGDHNIVLIHRDILDNEEPTQASAWGTCEVVSFPEIQIIPQTGLGVRVIEPSAERQQECGDDHDYDHDYDHDNKEKEDLSVDGQMKPIGNDNRIAVVDTVSMDLSEQQRASTNEEEEGKEVEKKKEKSTTMKKERKKKKQEKHCKSSNPKADLVIVDIAIPVEQHPPSPSTNEKSNEIVDGDTGEDEYVDLSAQMIHDLNNGLFDVYVEDKNVHVTHFH